MRKTLGLILLVLGTTGFGIGDAERGNRLYRSGQYAEAVEAYRAALHGGEDTPVLRYNLGTALLRLGQYREAEEHLRAALDVVEPGTREYVYYNLGQRYLEEARGLEGDPQASAALYDAAVEAYKQALRLAPTDTDAKWNYELAVREREEQQQGGGGGGGDQEEQDDQEQAGGQGGGGQSRGTPEQSPSGGQANQAQAPLTQEQAERILSAVEQDERELFRDKLRKGQQTARPTRDW